VQVCYEAEASRVRPCARAAQTGMSPLVQGLHKHLNEGPLGVSRALGPDHGRWDTQCAPVVCFNTYCPHLYLSPRSLLLAASAFPSWLRRRDSSGSSHHTA